MKNNRILSSLHKPAGSFLFQPSSPFNLGISRFVFFGILFFYYFSYQVSAYCELSGAFWQPVWIFKALHLPVLPERVLSIMTLIWKLSLALSCLGLFTRASTLVSFLVGIYLVGLPFNFGYASHYAGLLLFIFGIMAFARCGDGFSLDELRRRSKSVAPPEPSGEYTWPIRLVWVLISTVFFAAGVSKLRASGLTWITSDFFAFVLRRANYPLGRVASPPLTTWGLYLAQFPLLCHLLAAGTILLELGYPLALFSRSLRYPIVLSMILVLVGVRIVLGPPFETFIVCQLFWIPWDKALVWQRARAYSATGLPVRRVFPVGVLPASDRHLSPLDG